MQLSQFYLKVIGEQFAPKMIKNKKTLIANNLLILNLIKIPYLRISKDFKTSFTLNKFKLWRFS